MPDGLSVTGWTVDRGRTSELDKTATGTANVTMIDTAGNLDPTYTSGPFYGNLDPMKPAAIALYNPFAAEWSTVFTGFTSEWQFDLDVTEKFLNVTLELVDAFDMFESLGLTPGDQGYVPGGTFADVYFQGTPSNLPGASPTAKHVDTRIHDLLDAIGWPDDINHRDIFSGNVEVQGKVYERFDSAMSAIADAVDAEFPGLGNFYMDRLGVAKFHGRFARFFPGRPAYGINTWVVGDTTYAAGNSSSALIAPIQWRRSEADIINSCTATPQGIDDSAVIGQVSTDSTSIGIYGYRSVNFDNLITHAGHDDDDNPTTDLEETKKFANYYVGNYATPRNRIQQLVFRPLPVGHANAAAQWGLLCGVEISDIVSLTATFPWGGGFDEDFYVEGIHYDADVQGGAEFTNVTLTLDVSPRAYYDENTFGDWDDT